MHQITAVIDSVRAAFDAARDANPVFMSTAEKRSAIVDLKRLEAQVVELRLRVEAEAHDVVDRECARDISAVLVAAGLDDAKHARSEAHLCQALTRYEQLRAGMAAGEFTHAHAHVIAQTLDDLPDDVGHAVVARAEVELCGWARQYTPQQLGKLGQRILSVVDPDAAEAIEARWLRNLEEEAAKKATLTIRPLGDGTSRIHGIVPDAVGHGSPPCWRRSPNPARRPSRPTAGPARAVG